MKIYISNPETGEFLHESIALKDPLETKKIGKDVFLIPSGATTTPPPTLKDNEVAILKNSKWQKETDCRYEQWYDDNGNPIVIDFLGNPRAKGLKKTKPKPSKKQQEQNKQKERESKKYKALVELPEILAKAKDFNDFKKQMGDIFQ